MIKIINIIKNFEKINDLIDYSYKNKISFIIVTDEFEYGLFYNVIQPIDYNKLDYKLNKNQKNSNDRLDMGFYQNIVRKISKDELNKFRNVEWLVDGDFNYMFNQLGADYYLFFDSVDEFENHNKELTNLVNEMKILENKYQTFLKVEDHD